MEQECREYLLDVARAYGKAQKLALSTVSRRFHGADHFLEEFERGAVTVTLRKYDEMLLAFRYGRKARNAKEQDIEPWPKRAKWPKRKICMN